MQKIVYALISVLLLSAAKAGAADVGEMVDFGDYRGENIHWFIGEKTDINGDGVLDYGLISANILMYKAFDQNTNIWKNSSLRSWLNSTENQSAQYGEPGFLSEGNFSPYEYSLILPVTHKSMSPEKEAADGGTTLWAWNDGGAIDYKLALTNYNEAYYILSEDRIFLPSTEDLVRLDMPWSMLLVNPTASAGENKSGSQYGFLLRDAAAGAGMKIRWYYEYQNISARGAALAVTGIRLMTYLDGSSVLCGNGTKDFPYYISDSRDGTGAVAEAPIVTESTNKIEYSVKLKNFSYGDYTAVLMAGVYDENGLCGVYSSEAGLTAGRTKTISVAVPKPELDGKTVRLQIWNDKFRPLDKYKAEYGEEQEFKLNSNMFFSDSNILISSRYAAANAFDKNTDTSFAVSDLTGNDIVFSFKYPSTITGISLQSVSNSTWAKAKTIEILAYNDEFLYRNKKKEPVLATQISLENSADMQNFDLAAYKSLKDITHLVLRVKESYKMSGGAVWGGFSEMKISGMENTRGLLVSKLLNRALTENNDIARLIGITLPEGYADAEDMNEVFMALGLASDFEGAAVSGDEFYNALSQQLGYTKEEFMSLGTSSLYGIAKLTGRDVGIGIFEALMMSPAGSEKTLAELLHEQGKLPDLAYEHILDKTDVLAAAHIGEYTIGDKAETSASFTFSLPNAPKIIESTNFAYNAPFHYAGIYYGTLPEENPLSKREEFKSALEGAGAKALRFPGGLPAHQYLIEGKEKTAELTKAVKAYSGKFGGLYDANDSNNSYYVELFDFLDFCQEADIEPIFQVNTSFYTDKSDGKVHAICKNYYIAKSETDFLDSLYDYDRIDKAAAALGENIDSMLAAGYTIKYWEIGNEDFGTLNYLGTALTDESNPATQNYIRIATAFAKVIKQKIPNSIVIVTGDKFTNQTSYYIASGGYELMDYASAHYPFGYWTTPTANNKDNLTTLLSVNEQGFVSNAGAAAETDYSGQKLVKCTTETSCVRFESWQTGVLQNTFAMALNDAHQWGEAVFETPWKISVLHDLESPYFGFVPYNMKFNPLTRAFTYQDKSLQTSESDIPEDYSFPDQYLVTPAARAIATLSEHVGAAALKPSETSEYKLISVFASQNEDNILITAVNKMNIDKNIDINFSGITLSEGMTEAKVLTSDNLGAILPREYSVKTQQLAVSAGNAVSFTARPYSIYQFTLTAK